MWVQLRWRSIISTWLLWGIAAYKGRGTAGDEREASSSHSSARHHTIFRQGSSTMQLVEANLIDPMTPTNWCCVHPYDLLNTLPWWLTTSRMRSGPR